MCLVPAPGEFWAFKNLEKWLSDVGSSCGGFCVEWKLVSTTFNQMQVKQIISKDSAG